MGRTQYLFWSPNTSATFFLKPSVKPFLSAPFLKTGALNASERERKKEREREREERKTNKEWERERAVAPPARMEMKSSGGTFLLQLPSDAGPLIDTTGSPR